MWFRRIAKRGPIVSSKNRILRRPSRGVSAVDYIVVLVLVGISGIAVFKALGSQYRCKMLAAINIFADKGASDSCDADGSSGAGGSNGPSGAGGPAGSAGPTPNITCVGTVCSAPNQCFVAGTLVMTEAGERPIEAIAVGTRVLARDSEGDALDWRPVVRTFDHRADALIRLTIGDNGDEETVEVTPEHRVFVDGRGWAEAQTLTPGGDRLVDADGAAIAVQSAESEAGAEVFNLEVDDFHTYFVGRHHALAHNSCSTFNGPNGQTVTVTTTPRPNDPNDVTLTVVSSNGNTVDVHYTIDPGPPAVLTIGTIASNPPGGGLGRFTMGQIAQQALDNDALNIQTTLTAPTAQGFYGIMGFTPEPNMAAQLMPVYTAAILEQNPGMSEAEAEAIAASKIPVWQASTASVWTNGNMSGGFTPTANPAPPPPPPPKPSGWGGWFK
jgi:hypothetical protein